MKQIGFVGSGQMAQALAGGFVRAGVCAASDLAAYDPNQEALEKMERRVPGIHRLNRISDLITRCEVVVLAVKPHIVPMAAKEIGPLSSEMLAISIAAGVSLSKLSQWLGTERVVRVMPNTPCLVGAGASAYAGGAAASEDDLLLVKRLLDSVGTAVAVEERQMDAVTGLSGSGPAYVYLIIEALGDAGVRMGLPRTVAHELATATVLGAAEMVKQTGSHPGVLKDQVTSPGGTTITGLQQLEEFRCRAGLIAAVQQATLRATELGDS